MTHTFRYLILLFFYGTMTPVFTYAAAYSPTELRIEMETLAKDVLARIEAKPSDPTREEIRTYISQAMNNTDELLPDTINRLKEIQFKIVNEDVFGITKDNLPRRAHLAFKFISARKKIITEWESTDHQSSHSAHIISAEDFFACMPKDSTIQARSFLRSTLENIEKQNNFMQLIQSMAKDYEFQYKSSQIFEQKRNAYIKSLLWFSNPVHTDPVLIALHLKHASEWKAIASANKLTSASRALLEEMYNSGIKQLRSMAKYEKRVAENNKIAKRAKNECSQVAKKLKSRHHSLMFNPIPNLEPEKQPIYFAKKGLTCALYLNSYYTDIPRIVESGSEEEIAQIAYKSFLIEQDLINLVQEYAKHVSDLTELQAKITEKLKEFPEIDFIDPLIFRHHQSQLSSAKCRKKKQIHRHLECQTKAVAASSALPSTLDILEPTTTAQEVTGTSSKSGYRSDSERIETRREIEETPSMIRIHDPAQNITLAIFKLEKPTATSIKSCTQTAAMQLWVSDPDSALEKYGYFDESHKNHTPLAKRRVRMKQYHGFSFRADNYVTQCGIIRSYHKKDGGIHTMVCMPGAIYFADGTYQVGVFTYLIDPDNNQLYHRMFHEYPGEKIVQEYQARGYWDIDPRLS